MKKNWINVRNRNKIRKYRQTIPIENRDLFVKMGQKNPIDCIFL